MPLGMNTLQVTVNPRPHETPFVLMHGENIVGFVFDFLQKIHMRGVSVKTIRAYAFDLLCFCRFLSEKCLTLDTLTHQHFAEFILSQRIKNAAPRTINRRITVVRSLLNSLADGHGDILFGETMPAYYKGIRNKALLGKSRLKGRSKAFHIKVPSVLITPLTQREIKKFF